MLDGCEARVTDTPEQDDDTFIRYQLLAEARELSIRTAQATVGGKHRFLFEGPITVAFVKAARAVLNSGHKYEPQPFFRTGFQEIGAPCAYLQRHALELIIKAHLHLAGRLGELLGLPPLEKKKTKTHDFMTLIDVANARMGALGADRPLAIPQEVEALAAEIDAIEDGDDTAFRYEMGKSNTPSLPTLVTLPIGEWQDKLEALLMFMDLAQLKDLDSSQLSTYQWMIVQDHIRRQPQT